jgi:hypothetical protein
VKIGDKSFVTTSQIKTNLKKAETNTAGDQLLIGGNLTDESILMSDQLKSQKSFISGSAIMQILAIQAGLMLGGAGAIGFIGYKVGEVIGGPVAGAALAVAGTVLGGAAGHAISMKVT